MDFSKSDIIKLINLYRTNECLWNINSNMYKRTDIKINVLRKIAAELNIDEEIVEKKFKYLRTAYTAEKKRIDASLKKSGIDAEETESIIESKLFYYNVMSFLDKCIVHREGSKNFKVIYLFVYNNFNYGYLINL